MRSILMSYKPYWFYHIFIAKDKTLEVRNRAVPNQHLNYAYCTKDKKSFNKIKFKNKEERKLMEGLLGKVGGEFICNKVTRATNDDLAAKRILQYCGLEKKHDFEKKAMLSFQQMQRYSKCKDVFFLHIDFPTLYDKPKALHHFFKPCGDCSKKDTMRCTEESTDCRATRITRPPQSWQYVERE